MDSTRRMKRVQREIYACTPKFLLAFSIRIYYNICYEKQIIEKGPFTAEILIIIVSEIFDLYFIRCTFKT